MIIEQVNNVSSLDGNTVDSNDEMVKMAENQLIYSAASDMLKRKWLS
jgi:flagellar basal body rod protein FlgB